MVNFIHIPTLMLNSIYYQRFELNHRNGISPIDIRGDTNTFPVKTHFEACEAYDLLQHCYKRRKCS